MSGGWGYGANMRHYIQNKTYIFYFIIYSLFFVIGTAEAVQYDVSILGQRWEPWAGDALGSGTNCSSYTIGSDGCAITATAMVFNYFGHITDPRDMNSWLISNGGYASGCYLTWSKAADKSGNISWVGSWDYTLVPADLDRIRSEIDDGYPVIAEVRLFGYQHFVVITGYSGSTFYINDPWYGDQSTINSRYGSDPAAAIYGIRVYHGTGSQSPISVEYFWRRADPIIASNQSGEDNFDAQFGIKNYSSSSVTVDNMAIDIINQNDTRFAMWVKNSSTTLSPDESYATGIQYEELWYSGNYSVEVRLQIDGEWATHAKIDFQVVDPQTSFPDLVVESPSVDDNTLTPNEDFKIFATVRNAGNGSSDATTLRYYLSNNSSISTSDSEIGTDTVDPLSAGASSPEDKSGREAPSSPGTYWVGACVDAVSGESNTGNNCSSGVQITVADDPPASQEPVGYFDSADCNGFSGWTKDPDTTAPIDVHFYANGPAGTGAFIGSASANIYRGDLPYSDKNHGFSFPTPESLKDGQSHQIYVYALDDQGGANPLLTNSPKSIQCTPVNQTPVGNFESAGCSSFSG
ncbi:MAG: hypothetical protein D3908_00360, partial [Candidatus Electrothrix sp. AUS4]|nr:hypothetical protein [Candidatus Electrothrix sp. AUS4]